MADATDGGVMPPAGDDKNNDKGKDAAPSPSGADDAAIPAAGEGAPPPAKAGDAETPPAGVRAAPSGDASCEEKLPKPSPLFLYLVVVPVCLLLLYGLVAAAISGRYPKLAMPLRERIHRNLESEDASAAALELAAMSVGQSLEMVRRAFDLGEDAWTRLPAAEDPHFESPPLEAEEWRATVNPGTRPLFLVVHGTIVEWREE